MVNSQAKAEEQAATWKFIVFMLGHPEEYLQKSVWFNQPKN